MNDTKLFACRNHLSRKVSIQITRMEHGEIQACGELLFSKYAENVELPIACEITEESAVQLMNDLWDAGIRPHSINAAEIDKPGDEYKKILYAVLGIKE